MAMQPIHSAQVVILRTEDLLSENSRLKDDISRLRQENDTLRQNYNSTQVMLSNLETTNMVLRDTVTDLRKENESLRREVQSLKSENKKLRKEIEKVRNESMSEIEKLKKQFSEMQNMLQERQRTSSRGKVIRALIDIDSKAEISKRITDPVIKAKFEKEFNQIRRKRNTISHFPCDTRDREKLSQAELDYAYRSVLKYIDSIGNPAWSTAITQFKIELGKIPEVTSLTDDQKAELDDYWTDGY